MQNASHFVAAIGTHQYAHCLLVTNDIIGTQGQCQLCLAGTGRTHHELGDPHTRKVQEMHEAYLDGNNQTKPSTKSFNNAILAWSRSGS
jgi:hypothetical protein